MKRVNLLMAAVLSAAVFVGCDDKKETPMTPPPAPSVPPTPSATETRNTMDNAGTAVRDATADAVDKTKEVAGNAADATRDAAAATVDKTKEMAGNTADATRNATDNGVKMDASVGTDSAVTTEVTTLIDQATTYIKENKWELADSTMAKLDGMKDKIPASLKPRYDQVKSMYDTAKAGKNMSMPTMGK